MAALGSYTPTYGGWTRGQTKPTAPSRVSGTPLGGLAGGYQPPTGGITGGMSQDEKKVISSAVQGPGGDWYSSSGGGTYDPTRGTWVSSDPPDPARDEMWRQIAASRAQGNSAMDAAQRASQLGSAIGAQWTVGPDGSVSFQGGSYPTTSTGYQGSSPQGSSPQGSSGDREALLALLRQELGASTAPPVSHAGSAPASSAAFSRALERTAQTNRSALNALYDIGAASGRSGTPLEAQMAGSVIGEGQGALADFNREQAIQDATRAGQVADLSYQGGITQRGQDQDRRMQIIQALLSAYGQQY